MLDSIFRCGPRCLDGSSIFEIGRASGGAPPPPPWYQPIVDLVGGGFVCVYTEGVETADPGAQVTAWNDVRGTPVWLPSGATSTRPVLAANGITFDGVDDRIVADAFAALFNGAHTWLVGFDDPNDAVVATRTLGGAATATTTSGVLGQNYVNYSNPAVPSTTRQRWLLSDNTSGVAPLLGDLSPLGAGPYDLAFRTAAPGGGAEVVRLLATPTSVSTATRTAGTLSHALLTLGARRYGAAPVIGQYWQGRIRYAIMADSVLDNTALATIRTALLTQTGLIT